MVTQVKEKLGGLKFYYDGGDEHVRSIVSFVEFISGYICETTGKEENVGYNKKGFVQTLHSDLKKNTDDFNFVDDEELRTILKNI